MAGKADIVNSVAQATGVEKATVDKVLDGLLEAIGQELENGEKVSFTGFGNFSISERAPREGRNPATGQMISIPAKRAVRFKAGKKLADRVDY